MDLKKNSFKILNALAKPIFVIDRNYHIAAANNVTFGLFGLPPAAVIGRECFEVTHKGNRPCWQVETKCPVKLTLELKERTKVIHKHIYSGKTIFEEITATPIFDDEGEVEFVIEEFHDITEMIQSKEIAEHLKQEIKTLRGIIPICSSCKKIRDDQGYWQQVETYVRNRSKAEFSHSICNECLAKLYPKIANKIK